MEGGIIHKIAGYQNIESREPGFFNSSAPAESSNSSHGNSFQRSSRRATTTPQDAKLYNLAQGLVPLMNNPALEVSNASSIWCLPFGMGFDGEPPPPLPPGLLQDVSMQHFKRYTRVVAQKYEEFEMARQGLNRDAERRVSVTDITPGLSNFYQYT